MTPSQDPKRNASRGPLQLSALLLVGSVASFIWVSSLARDHQAAYVGAAVAVILALAILFVRAPWVKTSVSLATALLVLVTGYWIAGKGSFAWRDSFHGVHVTYTLLGNVLVLAVVRSLLNRPTVAYHFASDRERKALDES